MTKVTLQDIKNAKETIKDIVKQTDILESAKLSAMTGANVFYKCENLQKTGSFKVRGACNKISNLTEEGKWCYSIKCRKSCTRCCIRC